MLDNTKLLQPKLNTGSAVENVRHSDINSIRYKNTSSRVQQPLSQSLNQTDEKKPVQAYTPLPGDTEAPLVSVEPDLGDVRPKPSFFARLFGRYNKSFLFALGLQYFNTGMRSMITMAVQYMFLETYGIPPAQANAYLSYINLPWTPKLLYGIITDVFPICGSGKRSYVFIMGFL